MKGRDIAINVLLYQGAWFATVLGMAAGNPWVSLAGVMVALAWHLARARAPLREAQLIESRIINLLHFQILIASKAARIVLAAPGKRLVDFVGPLKKQMIKRKLQRTAGREASEVDA